MFKFFRLIFLLLMILILIGGGVLAYFCLTFDPNRYRPDLETRLSELAGMSVRLENLSLGWQSGLVFKVDGIQVRKSEADVPCLTADTFLLRLDPFSLLKMQIGLSELKLVRPQLLLVRGRGGRENWSIPTTYSAPNKSKPAAEGRLALLLSSARLEDGRLHYRDETQTPALEIELADIEAKVERQITGAIDLEAEAGKGMLKFEGKVSSLLSTPDFQGKLSVNQLDLERLTAPSEPAGEGRGYLGGTVSGNFDFQGRGTETEAILGSLDGKGNLEVKQGVLRGVNLPRLVLQRISVLPGLESAVLNSVPEEFREVFLARDTVFESIQTRVSIKQSQVHLESFLLRSEHYVIEGQGEMNLLGDLVLGARIAFLEKASQYLVERVHELSLLSNPQGQIVIPFTLRGRWPAIQVLPDVGDLARRALVGQGTRWLEEGLAALSKKKGETQ